MKNFFTAGYILAFSSLFLACSEKKIAAFDYTDLLHRNQQQLTKVIIYDVFSPPVASRIYAYSSLAAYESIRHTEKDYPSITANLKGFNAMPLPDKGKEYDYALAATKAYFMVVHKIVFSVDSLQQYESAMYANFKSRLDQETYNRSMAFGDSIGSTILQRAASDNYKKTRGMPKYLGSKEDGKWEPTPPDYLDGAEPFWSLIKPLVLDSASQFKPESPLPFDSRKNSPFYKNTWEVYNISKSLTDDQLITVKYWDDNPFVMEHSGHLMFANKKITPGGHWMGIAGIAAKKINASPAKTAQLYALTAIALFDSFIACWDEKYRSQYVRPVTVIHNLIDDHWDPYLQTPPFPEHPSGHSTISAAAATMLTEICGDNFSFHDDSDKDYINMERDFKSFYQASDEASFSRLYGGIHFRTGIESGRQQGREVGAFIVKRLGMGK